MISAVPWRWVEESESFVAEVASPRRTLTIRWDDGDQGWFLAVIDPGRPATMGQAAIPPRTYVTPMPLLVAMTLLPGELHEELTARVKRALDLERDSNVLGHVQSAVGSLPLPWPTVVHVREDLEHAAAAMVGVERLALDHAASEAWSA